MLIAIYSLFIIPMITSFFSVLGMAIERFQAFAVYRDTRVLTKRFSVAWFLSSWTLAICFVVILKFQLKVCSCCVCLSRGVNAFPALTKQNTILSRCWIWLCNVVCESEWNKIQKLMNHRK